MIFGSGSVRIDFPSTEFKVQSPYLYLQSVGSTGIDGSTYGAHVRWLLLRNLGDTHFPKGDSARTNVNFNRPDDYVTLFRSPYVNRFPTVVDFSAAPTVVNDSLAFWIYRTASTNTVAYIYFRDTAKYNTTRSSVDPAAQPLQFVQQYMPGVIEVELKDKLFFAVEFDVVRTAATVMRAEALSVETNVPLSPVFVSCRKRFTNEAWCPPDPAELMATANVALQQGAGAVDAPACCSGPNLLINGGFEPNPAAPSFAFETDYLQGQLGTFGTVYVTANAAAINGQWFGLPHSGKAFLAVDGSTQQGKAVLRFRRDVDRQTDYCFSGWLSTLYMDEPIKLQLRFTSADGTVQTFDQTTPARVKGGWEQFSVRWSSGTSQTVVVEIISTSLQGIGNDFGIDDLWFCKSTANEKCRARIRSENIRSIRFDVTNGYPRAMEFETYDDYIAGAAWETLGKLALTLTDSAAFSRLEPSPGSVDGRWQKFNDNALVNIANYKDRWSRAGGLKEGVQRYITASDTDPLAIVTLPGAVQPQDGSIQISMLDALRMVSLDFHVARMLGVGLLDRNLAGDTDSFIYLGVYDTAGALDDTQLTRPVRHYYMGVPTSPLDDRLPAAPLLDPVTYGLTVDNGEPQPSLLTDPQGYTPDGLARYVNLFVSPESDIASLNDFFVPPVEFCAIDKTPNVFFGVEYRRQGESAWRKPEVAHDTAYKDLDSPPQFETLPLPNNPDPTKPILRHEERESGIHEYGGYGGNWFSRVSPVGNIVATDATVIRKAALLLPPSNFAVQLIQTELPVLLTTSAEQAALTNLPGPDKTLVRATFDYFHVHDINYGFADTVELFFRPELPRNVVGALVSAVDDPADGRNAILRTTGYVMNSQGTTITPALDPNLFGNFVGGVFSCQQENYIIAAVSAPSVAGEGPIFTVQKNVKGNPSDPGSSGAFVTVQESIKPEVDSSSGVQVIFMAVENMADANSWGNPNPLSKTITIGDSSWTTQQETYVQDGDVRTVNLRGVWSSAIATPEPALSPEPGVYRIAFQSYTLPHHSQSLDADPVDWYKGVVRIARANEPNGAKKALDVLLMENVGGPTPLVLHVIDNAFDASDPIVTGVPVTVNYYPGYRVYLHADAARQFTEATILPTPGEGSRKTCLGARSRDTLAPYASPVGIPAPIVAIELIEPFPPAQPRGGEFATWPDYYYKSSYTFAIDFPQHKPFAAVMYRANEEAILSALYNDDTRAAVRQQLALLGENDPWRADRWRNLIGFDYVYDVPGLSRPFFDPTHSNVNGTFRKFPPEDGYAFPNPDKGGALNGAIPGSVLADVQEAVWGAFIALTERPLIYDFIKGPAYVPVPKAQKIRDGQGTLLSPSDPAFDMAPMAKRTGNGFEIQFTDFTLDGTGNNIFFYCGREIGNRGRISDPGAIAGPVQLINTRPPDAPAVKKMYVREPSLLAGTGPAVQFEVNAYPTVQKVGRMLIYRATDPADALSVRTMQLVKTIDLNDQAGNLNLSLADDFESGFVPYGDPLFYRIVALRKVRKPGGGIDWAPSQSSKVLLTTMIDAINPEAPEISFTSAGLLGSPATLTGVVLAWPATAYNGTYSLEKMNNTGNWVTIYRIKTNQNVTVDLAATDLGTNALPKENTDDGRSIYNRFRVRVENSSGLFNLTERVLTL
jgi:hypothetical protein